MIAMDHSKSQVQLASFTDEQQKELCLFVLPIIQENKILKKKIQQLSESNEHLFVLMTDIIKKSENPLLWAIKHDMDDYLRFLIKAGWNSLRVFQHKERQRWTDTVLHVAAQKGSVKCAEIILKKSKNPDLYDSYRNTPLHIAAKNHKLSMVLLLRRYGADPLLINKSKKRPIDLLSHERSELIERKIAKILSIKEYTQDEVRNILAKTI
jgi:ankyrin repeat protein